MSEGGGKTHENKLLLHAQNYGFKPSPSHSLLHGTQAIGPVKVSKEWQKKLLAYLDKVMSPIPPIDVEVGPELQVMLSKKKENTMPKIVLSKKFQSAGQGDGMLPEKIVGTNDEDVYDEKVSVEDVGVPSKKFPKKSGLKVAMTTEQKTTESQPVFDMTQKATGHHADTLVVDDVVEESSYPHSTGKLSEMIIESPYGGPPVKVFVTQEQKAQLIKNQIEEKKSVKNLALVHPDGQTVTIKVNQEQFEAWVAAIKNAKAFGQSMVSEKMDNILKLADEVADKTSDDKLKRMNLGLPPHVYKTLGHWAVDADVSLSKYIETILTNWVSQAQKAGK